MTADLLHLEAWVHGWSISRSTPPPIALPEGYRIDVGQPHHLVRYVLPTPQQELLDQLHEPGTWLKTAGDLPTLSPRWTLEPPEYLMTTPLKPSRPDTAPAAPTTPGANAPATSVQIPGGSTGADPQMEPTAGVEGIVLPTAEVNGLTQVSAKADGLVEAAAEADGVTQVPVKADGLVQAAAEADGLTQVPAKADGLVEVAAEADGLVEVPDRPVQPVTETDGLVQVAAEIDGRVQLTTEVDGLTQVSIEIDGVVAARGQVAVWGAYATFDQIVTEPAYRRRGLGSVVMQALSTAATKQGARTGVLVATDDGRALYTRLGWELVSTLNVAWIRP